jgi:hypothetical protein
MLHEVAFRLGQSGGLVDTYAATPGHGDVIPFRDEYLAFRQAAEGLFRDRERAAAATPPAVAAPAAGDGARIPAAAPKPPPVYSPIKFNPLTPQRGRSLFAGVGSKKGTLSGRLFHWLGERTMPETYAEILPHPKKVEEQAAAAPKQEEKSVAKKEEAKAQEGKGEEKKKKAA